LINKLQVYGENIHLVEYSKKFNHLPFHLSFESKGNTGIQLKKDSIPDYTDPVADCPPIWNCDTVGQNDCTTLKKFTSGSFKLPGFPNCPLFASGSHRLCTRKVGGIIIQEYQFTVDTIYFALHNKYQCNEVRDYLDTLLARSKRGEVWKNDPVSSTTTVIKDGKMANDVLIDFHRNMMRTAFEEISKSIYHDGNKGSESQKECKDNDPNCEKCETYFRNVQGYCMMTVTYRGDEVVDIPVYPNVSGIKVTSGVIVPNPRKPDSVIHQSDAIISYYQCGSACCHQVIKLCFEKDNDPQTGLRKIRVINVPPTPTMNNRPTKTFCNPLKNPRDGMYPISKPNETVMPCSDFCIEAYAPKIPYTIDNQLNKKVK
jgi:hypothetical protein